MYVSPPGKYYDKNASFRIKKYFSVTSTYVCTYVGMYVHRYAALSLNVLNSMNDHAHVKQIQNYISFRNLLNFTYREVTCLGIRYIIIHTHYDLLENEC
jgi:hypothetical protein